ncbi:MEDS domain-containing protein [Pradoshia sp.]
MNDKIEHAIKGLNKCDSAHICYLFNGHLDYLENVVSFILTGIKDGDHILLVENDRNILAINERVQKELSMEQLTQLHFINNYHFYFSNGNFHPETVASHFLKIIEPHNENGDTYRTWGHIEWGCEKEIERDIEAYEKEIDKLVKNKVIISVCAYHAERTSDSLKEKLKNCHDVMIIDPQ